MGASISAKAVANDVLEAVGKGEIPNITKLAVKRGYKLQTANRGRVTQTKSYKSVIVPFVKKLEIERERAIDQLKKKISKAKYRDLNDAIDKLTKTHQLLTGGATENVQEVLVRFIDAKDNRDTDRV